jgi:hypothetical protein
MSGTASAWFTLFRGRLPHDGPTYLIDIDELIDLTHTVGEEDAIEMKMRPNAERERWSTKVVGVGHCDQRHWS